MKTDLEIQKDVMQDLKWESFLKSTEIGVSVSEGVVTLSGIIDSYSKVRLAESVALKVGGVKDVENKLIVRFDTDNKNSDSELAKIALEAINWHSVIPKDRIKIKVEEGWITVTGEVDWKFEKDAIRSALENIIGVKGISNLVSISLKNPIDKREIKAKISKAFHRSATIDANNIAIGGTGNKIILRGIVQSYAEKQDAEKAAWNAPGVSSVENRLEVEDLVFMD